VTDVVLHTLDPGRTGRKPVVLSKRQLEILRLAAAGLPNRRIAKRLVVAEQTVKFHLSNVYRKIGVRNRTEAGRWARSHGVLDANDDA
jgi:DNA-binding NarL/FixJ family response regulator